MAKILVTGGAGMIGSNLVKRLVAEDHDVFVVDNLWRGKIDHLKNEAGKFVIPLEERFFLRDLAIPEIIDGLVGQVEYVIHLADIVAGIDYVFAHQGEIFRKNIVINSNVIHSIRKNRRSIKGFIYTGTACSFPSSLQKDIESRPLREEDLYPAQPESAYGWSKLIGNYETELLEKETQIPCSILMLHNVYGTPCDIGPRRQVIPSLITKAIRFPREPFIVWGSGSQGRAFVHVDDVVDAIVLTLEKGLGRGTIQIGPSSCTTIQALAEMIVSISGKDIKIIYDTTQPEGDRARRADYRKARDILGWDPKIPLRQGLEDQYRWIEQHMKRRQWVIPLMYKLAS
ncbi:NAD-dependent epimerase/dehydratase family protein [Synechococcus sp. Nb3U1]|uniref:NAD-dependent epimerase/dehydratase family protein n=1 Tax=Synechococcus sp. Nb3U1 TaxID=1914529 RepID=UPI001F26A229|nr:NAD-dependent epimerase/dehydratase family protein [Synechococcus sp. Nb3U1]MCF2970147.1 NAD-dependent epimerase/dehydratase family protein [Synechococcus sp. Nb3U1]